MCPALERKRAAKKERQSKKRKRASAIRKKEREKKRDQKIQAQRKAEAMLHVCGLDLKGIARRVCRMFPGGRGVPEITVKPMAWSASRMPVECYATHNWRALRFYHKAKPSLELRLCPDATTRKIERCFVMHVLYLHRAPEHRCAVSKDWSLITDFVLEKIDLKSETPEIYAITWGLVNGWGGRDVRKDLESWLGCYRSQIDKSWAETKLVEIDKQLALIS